MSECPACGQPEVVLEIRLCPAAYELLTRATTAANVLSRDLTNVAASGGDDEDPWTESRLAATFVAGCVLGELQPAEGSRSFKRRGAKR